MWMVQTVAANSGNLFPLQIKGLFGFKFDNWLGFKKINFGGAVYI